MEEEKPAVQVQQFTHFGKFTIFLLIKTAQNIYGIKGGDYVRYRRYCGGKILKLRKSLSIKYGNKTKYFKKDILKEKPNDRKTLQVLLFNAEKNWAFANETKFSQSRKASQKSRGRFFAIKKLRKALLWARRLSEICKERTDSITKLQAEAYQLYLEGLLNFQIQNWQQTQIKLIACRQIMTEILKVSDSMSERVFKEKIDQIEQTIKFCSFKLSKGKELSISEIIEIRKTGDASLLTLIDSLAEQMLNEISLNQAVSNQIRFKNERYPIKQDLIIKQKAKVDLQLQNLEVFKTKAYASLDDQELYKQLLSFYSDIAVLVEEAIKITDSERQDPKKKQKYTQGELEILKKVSLLFFEIRVKLFIDRNITIFKCSYDGNKGKKNSPQTLAKLLSATISLFQQLSEVVKEKGQISNSFEIEHIQAIDAKNFYLRTLRLVFVGQVYFNNEKIKQAYSLWSEGERCLKILLSKEEMNQNKDEDNLIGRLVDLNKMMEVTRSNKLKCLIHNFELEQNKKNELTKNLNEIHIGEQTSQDKGDHSITLETLISEKRSKDHNLTLQEISRIPIIELPGKLQLIPTRPIFFDIFQATIKYPDIENKIKANTNTNTNNAKSAWWSRIFK